MINYLYVTNEFIMSGKKDSDTFYIDGKRVSHDEWCKHKGYRKVIDTPYNFNKEELKLSVRIAKYNVRIDPSNKYYLSVLDKAEKKLTNEL